MDLSLLDLNEIHAYCITIMALRNKGLSRVAHELRPFAV